MNGSYIKELLNNPDLAFRVVKIRGKNKKLYYHIDIINNFNCDYPNIVSLPVIRRDVIVYDEFGIEIGDEPTFPWAELDAIAYKGGFINCIKV
jgi:hypothetical protein